MTHTSTEQPEALRWAEVLDALDVGAFKNSLLEKAAAELRHQHARIAELEAQLSAIGAGGVEPLRKSAPAPTPNERAAFEAWLRVKPCGAAHDFAWEAWRARAALAATQPAAQGMDACKDRDTIFFLAGWNGCSEGLDAHEQFKKATIAAQAKQGERP